MDITAIKAGTAAVAEKYGLDFVVLFGSQATGRTHAKSDVDVAVIRRGDLDLNGLTNDFYQLFRRSDVEVVDLARAMPTLWQAVIRDGKLLYERSVGDFLRWKVYAWKIWMETRWLRDRRDERLRRWARERLTAVPN